MYFIEELCLLVCNVLYTGTLVQIFQMNRPLPSSGLTKTQSLAVPLQLQVKLQMMSFLLGISPASCILRPTFRNTVSVPSSIGGEDGTDTVFRNVGRKLQDAGEIPKRKLIINTTRRKLKIDKLQMFSFSIFF